MAKAKAKRAASKRELPEGLDVAHFTMRAQAIDTKALFSAVAGTKFAEFRKDKEGVRCVLRLRDFRSSHAHFAAGRLTGTTDWKLDYEVVDGLHGEHANADLDDETFLKRVDGLFRSSDVDPIGLLSCHFSFSLKEWAPTVALPFRPAMPLPGTPGSPTIAGVDFVFPDEPGTALRRAFVTTYGATEQTIVRLLLTFEATLACGFTSRLIDAAASSVTGFVSRR